MYPKKSIMLRKCGRYTTVDKERVILRIDEHIEPHLDNQFDITIRGKMMEDKLRVIMFYTRFKQICLVNHPS